jgi:hypothetical protein
MLKNSRLFPFIFLVTIFSVCSAGRAVAQEEDLIHELPCSYRVEGSRHIYDSGSEDLYLRWEGRAQVGLFRITGIRTDISKVWAEFDISSLAGKRVADVGLRVFNSFPGTEINYLGYGIIQPSDLSCTDQELVTS